MAKKKNDNVLALAPLSSDLNMTHGGLQAWNRRWEPTEGERQLTEEARTQQRAIDVIATKARFAESKVGEIHQHAIQVFDETNSLIMEAKERPGRSAQHQAYMDQFSERQVQLLAQHSLGLVEVSATGIGAEVHRSPYPPPEKPKPAKRPGLLQRLLGGPG